MSEPFRVICADPPWSFDDKLPGPGRGAEKHYATMTVAQLCAFPLPPLADDCLLFLWRVAAMQQEALDVAKAWGFVLKSEIVWVKRHPSGKLAFGMGRTVRASHEVCLIATRGKPKRKNASTRSVFFAPRGAHSEKPEQFFRLVEDLCEGPYCEMFARKRRSGWTNFGLEVDGVPTSDLLYLSEDPARNR